jgi:hypothetical protein
MNAPYNLKRIIAGAVLSGGFAVAGLGLSAGVAQADPVPRCAFHGGCSAQWCPGKRLPAPDVKWDMTVCHDWLNNPYPGAVQVGAHVWEGEPCAPLGLFCHEQTWPYYSPG